ncbi:MAG: histidine kinase [Acidobacteria bacterium]|nr:histidine kinase [Acidobacteriota bacterium]
MPPWIFSFAWDAGLWMMLAIPLYALCRELPLDRARWPVGFTTHLLGSGMFSMAHVLGLALTGGRTLEALFGERFHWDMVVYAAIAAGSHAWIYRGTIQTNERRALELEAQLRAAQLEALRTQLQPHFLFNTLETISALMYQDVAAADRTIARLGDLLRHSFRNAASQQITLREEIDMLTRYLEIEQTRFADRLSVNMDIEAAAMQASIPNFLLQPLVENAIRHGITPSAGRGCVSIRARRNGEELQIEVADNGRGGGASAVEGVGLSNTRRRLETLFGANARLELIRPPQGGAVSSIQMPFVTATVAGV